MNAPEQKRRPRRNPLSREEVEAIIAFKRRKEQMQFSILRMSLSYKLRNLFLILSFFVFCEVLCCYFGPSRHRLHYTQSVTGRYAAISEKGRGQRLEYLEAVCVEGNSFKLLVSDFVKIPGRYSRLDVSSDFLLNCQLKASVDGMQDSYRLFRANPVLLLTVFCSFILLLGVYHNLNQNDYTLWGLCVLCGMTVLYLICV
jgi:hypothetical protein